MRTIFVATIAMAITGTIAVGAQPALAAPHLDSSTPSKCATHGSHGVSIQFLDLKGTGLAGPSTNGYTWPNDVQLYVSENGASFQQIPSGWSAQRMISGWSAASLSLQFRSTAMCTSPGDVGSHMSIATGLPVIPANVAVPTKRTADIVMTGCTRAPDLMSKRATTAAL